MIYCVLSNFHSAPAKTSITISQKPEPTPTSTTERPPTDEKPKHVEAIEANDEEIGDALSEISDEADDILNRQEVSVMQLTVVTLLNLKLMWSTVKRFLNCLNCLIQLMNL